MFSTRSRRLIRDIRGLESALVVMESDVLGSFAARFIVQELALICLRLVHRLVLAGTAHWGAPAVDRWSGDVSDRAMHDQVWPNQVVMLCCSARGELDCKLWSASRALRSGRLSGPGCERGYRHRRR
jgi:hypothetical protein